MLKSFRVSDFQRGQTSNFKFSLFELFNFSCLMVPSGFEITTERFNLHQLFYVLF